MFGAFFMVVPGLGKMSGLDLYGIAIVMGALALCAVAVSRVRRRLGEDR